MLPTRDAPILARGAAGPITTTLLSFEDPAYTTYDASIGVARDAWWTEVYAQNLTNVLASTFTSTSQFALQADDPAAARHRAPESQVWSRVRRAR